MGNRSDIFDHADFHTGSSDTANCGFTTGAGSFDPDFHLFHAQELSLFGSITGNELSGIGGTLAGTFEAVLATGGPADNITMQVGKGNFGIVKSRQNIGDTTGNIASAFAALFDSRSCRSRSPSDKIFFFHPKNDAVCSIFLPQGRLLHKSVRFIVRVIKRSS